MKRGMTMVGLLELTYPLTPHRSAAGPSLSP